MAKTYALLLFLIMAICLSACRTFYPQQKADAEFRFDDATNEAVIPGLFKVKVRTKASQDLCNKSGCVNVTLYSNAQPPESKSVFSCNEFAIYRAQGWHVDRKNSFNDLPFIESCNIVKFGEIAQPSIYSRFSSVLKGYKIIKFSPELISFLPLSDDNKGRAIWNGFNCGQKLCSANNFGTVELKNGGFIVRHGDRRRTSFFVGGRGDIDGDGWEDLMITYYGYRLASSEEGPDRVSGQFCLSWGPHDKYVRVTDCVHDSNLSYFKSIQ